MENASRALFIAAGVLLGVLILSVAVALFSMFGGSSKEIIEKIDEAKITEFNNNFLKYYSDKTEVYIDVYDVVTMANFAKKNNDELLISSETSYNQNSEYIQVKLNYHKNGSSNFTVINNCEKWTESEINSFIKENCFKYGTTGGNTSDKRKYYIKNNIVVNKLTKKIIYIEIEEI